MHQANAGKSLRAAVPCHFLKCSDEQEAGITLTHRSPIAEENQP